MYRETRCGNCSSSPAAAAVDLSNGGFTVDPPATGRGHNALCRSQSEVVFSVAAGMMGNNIKKEDENGAGESCNGVKEGMNGVAEAKPQHCQKRR
jgi:hypothetical protein